MSSIKVSNIQNGSSASTNIVLNTDGSATFAQMPVGPSAYAMRNKVINGAMDIDQRNAGASVTPTATGYTIDRWQAGVTQASKISVQQNAGAVTPPAGFTNYLGMTSLSAYSVLAGDTFSFFQQVEGLNVADFGWGTVNAATVTLSFWARSSLTGLFGGSIVNSAQNRAYPFSYTINAANTWEYKTITIPGDTSGTWLTNNGIGVSVRFSGGSGSNLSGTAGSWAAANYWSATGATSIVGTNGATFYITGVQLEVGSVATPFERRLYTTELQLAQRYCQVLTAQLVYAVTSSSGNQIINNIALPVAMRVAPTAAYTIVDSNLRSSGPTLNSSSTTSARTSMVTSGAGSAYVDYNVTFNSEL
jgi:hypothetical protein